MAYELKTIFLVMFFQFGNPTQDNGPGKYISCHVVNAPFEELVSIIYAQTQVRVYYDEKWVRNIKVTLDEDSIEIESAVRLAINGSGLKVSVWHNSLVVLPDEELIRELPDYEQSIKKIDSSKTVVKNITSSEERYLTGRKVDVAETIKIGKSNLPNYTSYFKIRGRMVEKETGEPAIGISMYIEETKTGGVSDKNGFISISLKPGKYNVKFEGLGFEKKSYFLDVISDGDFIIEVRKTVIPIDEVTVLGDRVSSVKTKNPGLEIISAATIKELPTMMGERDILKISSLLPGIVSVGENSSGLNVRGGGSDQNAFYINKIPIYNSSHLFGFFPAFNSDIIKEFSIYKGHIPVQYGGRLSSVFNIVTRQGNRKQFTVHGGVNPITGYITVEGPVIKDSLTLLFSARSSYSDWILSRIKDPTIRTSSAVFNDFAASLNYDRRKSQFSIFFYNSNDNFRLSDINSYQYSNTGGVINILTNFSLSSKGEFALIASRYSFETIDQNEIPNSFEHKYQIEHYEARSDFSQIINDKNTLEYGVNFILYKLNRGSVLPFGAESLRLPVHLGKEQGIESAIYLSDKYNILQWLTLSLGLRYSFFSPLGYQAVRSYSPGLPRDDKYVTDTLNFESNKPIKWYSMPEIRASVNIETDQNGSVKLAFNQMQQNLFMLSNTISVAPNTQWKLADYHLAPLRSNQFSVGVFRNIPKSSFETSVELFYKKTNNYPEFKDGADFLSSPNTETSVLQGVQTAYGIEFFIKRNSGKVDGWLSYTFSRSIVKVDGDYLWNKINEGKAYPANFDIPHVFNTVVNYHFSRRAILSTVICYQRGRPITYPLSIYYINSAPYIDYSDRNKYRIPDYFRIDMSFTLEGNLKKNKLLHNSVMFNVYNLIGRKNPFSVYYESQNGKLKSYKYSIIGIPFFTITWLFKLGNYVSQ